MNDTRQTAAASSSIPALGPAQLRDGARTIADDLMMGEFMAATSLNESVGEVFEDMGRAARVVRDHAVRQRDIGKRFFEDLGKARSLDQFLTAHLHLMRTSADNQLALATDAMRLQADAVARTRHMLAVGFAALEKAVERGRPGTSS